MAGLKLAISSDETTAILQADSTTQGVLVPRMTTTQRDAIGAPATGLLIFNTTNARHEEYNGSSWQAIGESASYDYYDYLAALLEPDAIEPMQTGAFNYAVASDETKFLLASYFTQLDAAGRMEVRNPWRPMALRDVSLDGMDATSAAVLLDPTIPTYTDARGTYFDRLKNIADMSLKVVNVSSPATLYELLPGAYGAIITRVVNFDYDYIAAFVNDGGFGWNFANEEQDGAAYSQRNDAPLSLPVSKLVISGVKAGAERSAGVGEGSVVYVLLPSTWSAVTDATSYNFRDDFMEASLDTASDWTRAQSVAGNVEINTDFGWLKMLGTAVWGQNGAYSQTSIARAAGKIFLCDVYTGQNATANNSHMVGFSDGGGQSYTNFSHGLLFTSTGAANQLKIYEDSNDRGAVGAGYDDATIYRVRITLGASDATYEIQGAGYGALGSASWTDITPGGTSSSTTPVHAGVSCGQTGTMYIGDVKVY